MTRQHQIALIVIASLILAAVVQATIMCVEVGIASGWQLVRNDPGKFIFHLLLLPVSFGALVWSFPARLGRKSVAAGSLSKYVVVGLGVALVGLGIGIGVQETIDGFETRVPVPTDVRATVAGDGGVPVPARAVLLEVWQRAHHTGRDSDAQSVEQGAPSSQQRAAAYAKALNETLGATRRFWKQGSASAWWAGFLSILGVWYIGAWMITIVIGALHHRLITPDETATLVVAFCIGLASAGLWFYFKIYSEWYINFYVVPPVTLTPLVMAMLAALGLALTAVLVQNAQQPLKWFGAMAAVGSAATGAAAYWKPQLLRTIADAYRQANNTSVIGLWAVVAISAFVAAYLTAVHAVPPSPPVTRDDEPAG